MLHPTYVSPPLPPMELLRLSKCWTILSLSLCNGILKLFQMIRSCSGFSRLLLKRVEILDFSVWNEDLDAHEGG